jgi:hypothetical protein
VAKPIVTKAHTWQNIHSREATEIKEAKKQDQQMVKT